ncbi:MAG: hypothetical protein ACTSUH_10615 [Candidatus Thorarchaeota archaeon]
MSPDWLMTRVVVVTMALAVPVYFFALMFLLPFQITPFGDPFLDWLFNYLLVPSVFSTTWVALIYLNRYRLANTVHLMRETTTSVPLRWRVFYGLNAAFVMVFFVLPVATAPVAVIGGLALAGTVFYRTAVGKLGLGRLAAAATVIVAVALCILPAYIMLAFIPRYLEIWNAMLSSWSSFWFGVVYGVAQCLVNALSLGAPIHFLYYGAQQYERGVYGDILTEIPTTRIRLAEGLLFLVFLILYLPPIPTPLGEMWWFMNMPWLFTTYINWISLAVVVIMLIIRRVLGVKDKSTMGGAANIAIVAMFLLVEIFFKTNLLVVTLVIWLAFGVFAAVVAANFMRASSREMY